MSKQFFLNATIKADKFIEIIKEEVVKSANISRYDIEEIKITFEQDNGLLNTDFYENSFLKLKNGVVFEISEALVNTIILNLLFPDKCDYNIDAISIFMRENFGQKEDITLINQDVLISLYLNPATINDEALSDYLLAIFNLQDLNEGFQNFPFGNGLADKIINRLVESSNMDSLCFAVERYNTGSPNYNFSSFVRAIIQKYPTELNDKKLLNLILEKKSSLYPEHLENKVKALL